MFESDLDMDMLQDEIVSRSENCFILILNSFNGLCFEWVSVVKLSYNGLLLEGVLVVYVLVDYIVHFMPKCEWA